MELGDLLLVLRVLAENIGEGRLFQHLLVDEDGGLLSDGKGERVGGSGVEFDQAAVLAQRQPCEESVPFHLVDEDVIDAGIEVGEHVQEKVVRHRAGEAGLLQRDSHLRRLRRPDPDRHDAPRALLGRLLLGLQHDYRGRRRCRHDERLDGDGDHRCSLS